MVDKRYYIDKSSIFNLDKKEPKKNLNKNTLIILLIILPSVLALIVLGFKTFKDGFTQNKNGLWQIKKEYKNYVKKKIDQPDECVVYRLVALKDGYYECKNCINGTFFLRSGEIVKYGLSCSDDPKKRYKNHFWKKYSVEMQIIYRGDLAQCTKEEARFIGNYPFTPENTSRPDPTPQSYERGRYRLLFPPMNSGIK